MYHIGQRFEYTTIDDLKEYYILARVNISKVCLINLKDGNCWDHAVEVNNGFSITKEEFDKTINYNSGRFKLVKEK